MQAKRNGDPFKRHKTAHRGVTFRKRADGERTYSVFFQGSYLPAGSTLEGALAKQAELRGKKARGEVAIPAKRTFREVAAEHLADPELKLRDGWRAEYKRMLERSFSRLGAPSPSARSGPRT